MTSILAALLLGPTAHAIPAQFTHQGRLLDAEGVPLDGEATITFRVTNDETGGDELWEETITLTLTNGFYSAVLGADDVGNPLDTDVLSQAPVWLELQLDGEPAMFPRSAINAVPYATMATVAEEVAGGPVDASQIAVGGTPVVNELGEWVGPTPTVSWSDIEGMPTDFADGVDDDTDTDTDSFAELGTSCLDGDIPVWDSISAVWACDMDQDSLADIACTEGQLIAWGDDATGWVCAVDIDTYLTEEDVDAMVSDNGYAMASEIFSGSFFDLMDLAPGLADGDDDTQLTPEEVDAIVADNGYAMAEDVFSGSYSDLSDRPTLFGGDFSSLTGVPSGLADGDDDTQLSETEVDAYVADDIAALITQIETLQAQVEALEASDAPGESAVMYGNYSVNNSVDIEGLRGYTELTGDLTIAAGDLPNLNALSSLTVIGGDLRVAGNDALTNLSGLENLESVGGRLSLEYNASLLSLNGLGSLVSVGDGVYVQSNDGLLNVEGLDSLATVGQGVYISSNNSLRSLQGFESLVAIGSALNVGDNPTLESLDGLQSVESIGAYIWVSTNPMLTDISSLDGLESLESWMEFSTNPLLCHSLVTALVDRLRSLGWTEHSGGSGNADC